MEPLTIMATTLAAVYTAYKAATDLGNDKNDDE
jgi:hypothetical protein